MTIWLIAVVLAGALAGLGYRQGAIRVGCSFLGIVFGAGLAGPLSGIVRRLLMMFSIKNPILLWAIPPVVVFIIVLFIFKAIGYAVHDKVEVHYKYRAGDLKLAFWERLNRRVGLCLGMANFAAYLVLICFAIFPASYWTYQLASGEQDPTWMRILNRLGKDLQTSGMDKVARAVDPKPRIFYDMADFTGVLYNNSLVEARLLLYPAFLGLSEAPELQDIANDKDFTEMWQRHDPIMNFYNNAKIQAILNNADLLRQIWNTAAPDLTDLETFLQTGESPKYSSQPLLGRWNYDVNAALVSLRKAKPNISAQDMQRQKAWMLSTFSKTSLVATTDRKVILKNTPPLGQGGGGGGLQNLNGEWTTIEGKYQVTVNNVMLDATIERDRLTLKGPGVEMFFERQD